jgi:hypothetical protein
MKSPIHPNHSPFDPLAEVRAGVLFVDLDETVLDGTVTCMTDEELINADLIQSTIRLIHSIRNIGIPVVMVTRNNYDAIDRFFNAKPELRHLFDDEIACEIGKKSEPINSYLIRNNIKKALFVDDTGFERMDVERSTEEVIALHPNEADKVNLAA